MDNPLWLVEPFTRAQAWVDLIMLANHKDGFIRVRGVRVDVPRGYVGWSEVALSSRWKWSRGKVRRFLKELENDSQIVQQKTNVSSLFAISNYEEYQQGSTASDTANGTANGQQTVQQTDTNKNVKKEKKGKKERKEQPISDSASEPGAQSGELFKLDQSHPDDGSPRNREDLLNKWNDLARLRGFPQVRKVTSELWNKYLARKREEPEMWALLCQESAKVDDFVTSGKWFSLHWFLNSEKNCQKFVEGNYAKKDAMHGFKPAHPAGMPQKMYDQLYAQSEGSVERFQQLTTLWRMNRS